MAKKTPPVLPQAPEGINLLYVVLGAILLFGLVFLLTSKLKSQEEEKKQDATVVIVDGKVNFETVSKGTNNNFGERVFYTVDSEKEWGELWNSMHAVINPVPELPKVDFEKEMLVLAFQGTQGTGGHSVEVTDIEKKDGVIGVTVKEVSPGTKCITTQALTAPYHAVKIPKIDSKFEFDIKYEKTECQ